MNKWLPTFLTVLIGGMAAASPDIQAEIMRHPNATLGLTVAYTIMKGLLPSPLTKDKE